MLKDSGYLLDMLNESRKLQERFAGSERRILDDDPIKRDAALWSLTVIGEAAAKVTKEFRDAHPEIPWRVIIGLRNVLVHNYAEINLDKVWGVISQSVPGLIPVLHSLIPSEAEL